MNEFIPKKRVFLHDVKIKKIVLRLTKFFWDKTKSREGEYLNYVHT